MLRFIDNVLNRITMYRVVLYYLVFLLFVAVVLAYFGLLPYAPFAIFISTAALIAISWIANRVFAQVFRAPTNVESVYITALILALLIPPPTAANAPTIFGFVFWAAVWAMASKFMFAIGRKHIFNPATFAVALTALAVGLSATWWVGNVYMLPFVLVGGLLVTRKIRRFDLVLSFLVAAAVTIAGFAFSEGGDPVAALRTTIIDTPIFFFAFAMLTEPLTTPPTRTLRMMYGALTGFLFAPAIHVGSLYTTPELALLAGNLFSYLVSPKQKLFLRLKKKIELGPGLYDFVFEGDKKLDFRPGQYLEWTLEHKKSDNRGNRRYFTIASAPTEREIRMGVKFYEPASSFKETLLRMDPGDRIVAAQLAGDFILPKNANEKIVLMAGGIGITPFRSMVKDLADRSERRPIVLFYSARHAEELIYRDVFAEAEAKTGLRTVYAVTGKDPVPDGWAVHRGKIDPALIIREVPDFKDRIFYLSGPRAMVLGFEESLRNIGVERKNIRTDFFPGFA